MFLNNASLFNCYDVSILLVVRLVQTYLFHQLLRLPSEAVNLTAIFLWTSYFSIIAT